MQRNFCNFLQFSNFNNRFFKQTSSKDECERLVELFKKVVEEWQAWDNSMTRDNLTHITTMERFQQHIGWNLENPMDVLELIVMCLVSIALGILASCAMLFGCNWRNFKTFLEECHDTEIFGETQYFPAERRDTKCFVDQDDIDYLSPNRTE